MGHRGQRCILTLYSHLHLCLSSDLFPSDFPFLTGTQHSLETTSFFEFWLHSCLISQIGISPIDLCLFISNYLPPVQCANLSSVSKQFNGMRYKGITLDMEIEAWPSCNRIGRCCANWKLWVGAHLSKQSSPACVYSSCCPVRLYNELGLSWWNRFCLCCNRVTQPNCGVVWYRHYCFTNYWYQDKLQ